jgi:hypothetical protein
MTVADLIERVLQVVREQFYAAKPARDFVRDRTMLMQAIARYGFACHRNGWEFEPAQIVQDLLKLLPTIKPPDHQWLPRYLESCIDRSIRQRAEQLQQVARKNAAPAKVAQRGLGKLQVLPETVIVREPGTVETLDTLYRDLRSRSRAGKQVAKARPAVAQPALF